MVELKINALNQLKLFKQSTFKDPLTFLDEDIQNAQRAHAENVVVKTTGWSNGTIEIFNDGEVLDDPQKLFSIAESGWNEDTVNAEHPFGIGFFSNITVSDMIIIESGNKIITFDVNKMLINENTEVEVQTIEDENEFINGFKLTLKNVDFDKYPSYEIKERLQTLSNFIHEMTFHYNGSVLQHIPLTECDTNCEFWNTVDNDLCIGWLGLGDNYIWRDSVDIYYKGRLVCALPHTPRLVGKLHIKDNVLNLVAPDRKNIMDDENLKAFQDMVSAIATNLCNKVLLEYDNDKTDISRYAYCINHYYDIESIKDKMSFSVFKSHNNDDMNYLSGLALALKSNNKIQTLTEYDELLHTEEQSSIDEVINIEMNCESGETAYENFVASKEKSEESHSIIDITDKKPDALSVIGETSENLTTANRETLSNSTEPIFFVEFKDVSTFSEKLFIARHYDLRIIICNNNVEYDILKTMHETSNHNPIIPLSELDENIKIAGTISNTELSPKEKRASMLFGMLSRMNGYDDNIFVIGDVKVTKTVTISSINIENTYIDNSINILFDDKMNKIYIDRSILEDTKLNPSLSNRLALSDVQFILTNIDNIAKSLAGYRGYSNADTIKDNIINCLADYTTPNTINDNGTKKPSRKTKKRLSKKIV